MNAEVPPFKNEEPNSESAPTLGRDITHLIVSPKENKWERRMLPGVLVTNRAHLVSTR